jgi:hypothetical protein
MREVSDVLRADLAKSNMIELVDRSNFEKTFDELSKQRMGFTDAGILSVNINFRHNNKIKHILKINWKVIFTMSDDRDSFNVVIPVSSQAGANGMSAGEAFGSTMAALRRSGSSFFARIRASLEK